MASGNAFISYRREDTSGYAGRLYDRLNARFPERVFMDVTRLDPGVDFVDEIQRAVGSCQALIVLIGKNWAVDDDGTNRLQEPQDFVRLEVGHALERKIRVIPVLVGAATLPAPEKLPPELTPLLRRQALKLDDAAFDYGVSELVEVLEKELGLAPTSARTPVREQPIAKPAGKWRKLMWIAAGVFGAFFALAIIGALIEPTPEPAPAPAPAPTPNPLDDQRGGPVVPVDPRPAPAPTPVVRPAAFNPVGTWGIAVDEGEPDLFTLDVKPDGTFTMELQAGGVSSHGRGNWQYQPLVKTLVVAGQDEQGVYFQEMYQVGEFRDGHYQARTNALGVVVLTPR
jgi:hypothetical protein